LFLAPLAEERDGGAVARQTLRAYFEAERNASSAAALLEVSRQTVGSRLRAIEERIGRPLSACANELEATMRLVTPPNSSKAT
jgi:DNA-binding PucR family transcriptional regulator